MNRTPLLFLNVLIIATCGLVYELLAGTLASFVLGDSVTQFSLIIGVYLSALGVGAWLSRFIDKELARAFIEIELGVAILGGASAPLLFLSFAHLSWFQIILFGLVFAIGVLVGLELPLLMRLLQEHLDFRDLVSRVLTFDYIGALAASLLFPIFLVPKLGLIRTSLVFGILNGAVGLWGTWLLRPLLQKGVTGLRARGVIVIAILVVGLIKADRLTEMTEEGMFVDPIVYTRDTSYQRIVMTKNRAGFQLFLNGNLQFSSADEYRYHEALVHPAILASGHPRRVLVLGGGDGLAVREILRHPGVESVTLVDLDPAMTELSQKFPPLGELNGHSLQDRRVTVINQDAYVWINQSRDKFDAAIVDFPDPNTFSLGKLYTRRFYQMLKSRLEPDAAIAIQCTSPLAARRSYWCVVRTLEAAGFHVHPYFATVPSFGVWGYALARQEPFEIPRKSVAGLKFLNDQMLVSLFSVSTDIAPVGDIEINRLDNQALVRYYEAEWKKWTN